MSLHAELREIPIGTPGVPPWAAQAKGAIALSSALCGDGGARAYSILPELVRLLLSPDASANAAELLRAICVAIPHDPRGEEMMGALSRAFAPVCSQLIDAHVYRIHQKDKEKDKEKAPPRTAALATTRAAPPAAPPARAAAAAAACSATSVGAFEVASLMLAAEHGCAEATRFHSQQMRQCLPSALLEAGTPPRGTPPRVHGRSGANGARGAADAHGGAGALTLHGALSTHLDSVRLCLRGSGGETQLALARLVRAYVETAPASLGGAIADAHLLEAALDLFFEDDVNGGGRQDFVRHVLIAAIGGALRADDPRLAHALFGSGRLLERLERGLSTPEGNLASPEHLRMLLAHLIQLSSLETVSERLAACDSWSSIRAAVATPTKLRRRPAYQPPPPQPMDAPHAERPHAQPNVGV